MLRLLKPVLLTLVAGVLPAGIGWADIPVHEISVVNTFPHDPAAFTQGLVFIDGELYEGTGRNGASSLRRVELETGEILQRHNLSNRYFGEGITLMGGRIFQLTWQSQLGFIYDRESFALQKTFFLPGEGWGITHDNNHLIVSDGTAVLRFLDPDTQREVRRVEVNEDGVPVSRLNELEYIDGEVWANVWYSDMIVRIDPADGKVNSKVDLSSINQRRDVDDVLNGIAWDADNRRLFVTGKLWPTLYEITVLPNAIPPTDVSDR